MSDRLKLLGKLEKGEAGCDDVSYFSETVEEAMVALNLTTLDMARKFGCTQSVVRHWLKKTAAPHPRMRPAVFSYLIHVLTTGEK